MNWDAFEPEVVKVIGDFLAKVPKSVVLLRLSPSGEILETNPAFTELFPKEKLKKSPTVQEVLEPLDESTGVPLPTALVTYRLLGSLVPGATVRGIHVPVGHGSVLVGERILPSSGEDLALLTATTNEMARLHREVQRNYRESKRALSLLETRHKMLVTSTDQGLMYFDPQGYACEGNPGAFRILGSAHLSEAEACLMNATGEDGVALGRESHPVIHALRTGQSRLGVVLGLKQGALWVLLDVMPEFEPGGAGINRICATFNDITERTRGEETLLGLTQRLQLATASAQLGVWDWDIQSGTMSWDDRMLEIYGISRDEILGNVNDWQRGLHPEDQARAIAECEAALQGDSPLDTEFRIQRPDGKVLWVKASGKVLRDAKGHPRRMIGLNQDITEKKMAEEEKKRLQVQLQQSQKMESLGVLAGGVAHDMNNVLGAILGLASAHIGTLPYGSPLHRALDTICKATERGGQMVKSLLSFAHQSEAEFRALDLNALLKDESSLLERTTLARIRTQMDLEPSLRPILGDAGALTHTIMNLCVNAVDAMPESGTLTLRTRNLDPGWVEVSVEDTGTGMSKEVQEKALEPFFTTKDSGKGTGLGLSMVYTTVKAHRGHMEIQSEVGKGTRIMIRIPVFERECPSLAISPPVESTSAQKGMEVLLVDDDELVQCSTQTILEVLGHRVYLAESGEAALAMFESGFQPDLVILDMNMPGLGGAGTLPRLRKMNSRVPVLLSTGRADERAQALISAFPGVTLVSKPFGLRELQKQLENIGLG